MWKIDPTIVPTLCGTQKKSCKKSAVSVPYNIKLCGCGHRVSVCVYIYVKYDTII